MRTPALIAIAALLTLSFSVGAQQIYTWKDASGKTIYSDKPPVEMKPTARELKSGRPVAATPVAPAQAAAPAPAAAAAAGEEAGKGSADAPEQGKADAAARQQLCETARKRLAQLESEKDILLTKNEKGEPVPLVGDRRKVELDSARKDVEFWCK